MRVKCQDCKKVLEDSECKDAKDLLERHTLGDIFSDLECPYCGALCDSVNTGWEKEFVQKLLEGFPGLHPNSLPMRIEGTNVVGWIVNYLSEINSKTPID